MAASWPQPIESIAGFAAMLRDHGVPAGVPEERAMVRAALLFPAEEHARLEPAWRAIACRSARDWRQWSDLFKRYWYPERTKGSTRVSGQTRATRNLEQVVRNLHEQMASESPPQARTRPADTSVQSAVSEEESELQRALGGASRTEALHDRTLTQWLPQDLALLQQLVEQIARRLRRRLTRRWKHVNGGRRLDVRRTLRRSLSSAGVPVSPAWKDPRRERWRLFILVDVSRSMETHAQLFLRIARAFVNAMNARVFVFHTRLSEISSLLRSDSQAVQEKIAAVTAGFGGGTRIATSLADFRASHARAQLSSGSRIWILSDGFDAEDPEGLKEQLLALRRGGTRLTWFHPSNNAPASLAFQAAAAVPGLLERVHKLNSLGDLARLSAEVR